MCSSDLLWTAYVAYDEANALIWVIITISISAATNIFFFIFDTPFHSFPVLFISLLYAVWIFITTTTDLQNCLNDLRSCYKLLQKILFYFAFKNTPNLRNQIKEKYQIFRSKTFKTILYKKSEQTVYSLLWCGGRGWIRTIEVEDNRFTVCPLWPLGNSPKLWGINPKVYPFLWSWWWDSNPRPADYKSAALPIRSEEHTSELQSP